MWVASSPSPILRVRRLPPRCRTLPTQLYAPSPPWAMAPTTCPSESFQQPPPNSQPGFPVAADTMSCEPCLPPPMGGLSFTNLLRRCSSPLPGKNLGQPLFGRFHTGSSQSVLSVFIFCMSVKLKHQTECMFFSYQLAGYILPANLD